MQPARGKAGGMQTPDWGALEAVDGVRLSWYVGFSPIDLGASAEPRSRRVRLVRDRHEPSLRAHHASRRAHSSREPSDLTATPSSVRPQERLAEQQDRGHEMRRALRRARDPPETPAGHARGAVRPRAVQRLRGVPQPVRARGFQRQALDLPLLLHAEPLPPRTTRASRRRTYPRSSFRRTPPSSTRCRDPRRPLPRTSSSWTCAWWRMSSPRCGSRSRRRCRCCPRTRSSASSPTARTCVQARLRGVPEDVRVPGRQGVHAGADRGPAVPGRRGVPRRRGAARHPHLAQNDVSEPSPPNSSAPLSECEFSLGAILENLQRDSFSALPECRPARCTGTAVACAGGALVGAPGGGGARAFVRGRPRHRGRRRRGGQRLGAGDALAQGHRQGRGAVHAQSRQVLPNRSPRSSASTGTLDVFACSLDQVGLAEMKVCAEKTGGMAVLAESFANTVFKTSFARMFSVDGEDALGVSSGGVFEVITSRDVRTAGCVGGARLDRRPYPAPSPPTPRSARRQRPPGSCARVPRTPRWPCTSRWRRRGGRRAARGPSRPRSSSNSFSCSS